MEEFLDSVVNDQSPLTKKIKCKSRRNAYLDSAFQFNSTCHFNTSIEDVDDSAYHSSFNTIDMTHPTPILGFSKLNRPLSHSSPQPLKSPIIPHYFDHPIYQLNTDIDTPISNNSPINPKNEAEDNTSLLLNQAKSAILETSLSDNVSNYSEFISPPRISFHNLNLIDKPKTPLKSKNLKRKFFATSLEKRMPCHKPLYMEKNTTPHIQKLTTKLNISENVETNYLSKESLTKQVAWMRESQAIRYFEEFAELECLGSGHFGSVYKCLNRLDGCFYAIKKSKTPFANHFTEYTAIKEVCAHAILGNHPHIVRYYSAWAEDGVVYIQNEYCNGGTLADMNRKNIAQNITLAEDNLKIILLHVARGLTYFHALKLAHLDIKPSNIFITKCSNSAVAFCNKTLDEGFESDDEKHETVLIYKIGDLGLVTNTKEPEVEEGDCRYLPVEILHENYSDITKADIFSLGMTILESASNKPLPPNGDEWQRLRKGELPKLSSYSSEFNQLLKDMLHSIPSQRPSARNLVMHPALCSLASKSKLQLKKELNTERFKNQILTKQLEQAQTENMLYKRLCQNLENYDRKAAILMVPSSLLNAPLAFMDTLGPGTHAFDSRNSIEDGNTIRPVHSNALTGPNNTNNHMTQCSHHPGSKLLVGSGVRRSLSVKDF